MPQAPSRALVSVVVRTMGRPELARALACVAAQTHRPLEIVLVDAAGLGVAMSEHAGIPVRVAGGGKLGRAQAANAGLDAARGEWVMFLDEDDEIASDHVAQLLTALDREPFTRAAYSQTRLLDAAGDVERLLGGPYDREALFRSNYLAMHAVLFARSLAADGARFDETLEIFEDWDFWLQLASRTRFAFTGQPTASYRAAAGQSGAGAGANLDRDAALAQRNRLMAKWQRGPG
jgi:glycosyltransferase involved in cell wall biosynthesis